MNDDAFVRQVIIVDSNDSRFSGTVERLPADLIVRRCFNLGELVANCTERAAVVVIGTFSNRPEDSITAAHHIKEQHPSARVVLVADSSSEALVVSALRAGVDEYLKAPLTGLDIADAVVRFLPSAIEDDSCAELVGTSAAMRKIKTMICRIARMNATVLITGETGTGKEIAARLIHRLSARSEKALVCVNCAAIPDALLESELFGYERGAFTGADASHAGQLKLADGGTLFLDEIGDMSAPAQAKILRALEQHEVQPLGGRKPVPVDIRTVAATHRDLDRLVDEGNFRSDLFYRLHVATLELPALRERPEDIPLLARHFLRRINVAHGRAIEDFTPSAMRLLIGCDWPGNVRQLQNTIEASALVCDSRRISEEHLRTLRFCAASRQLPLRTSRAQSNLWTRSEPDRLMQALEQTNWNMTKTAELLCWSRVTVYRKLAKYQLDRNSQATSASGSGVS